MSIDKSILYMSLYKQRLEESISDGLEEDIEAYDLCIDTMRKYQKIKEILKDDTYYEEYGNNAETFIVSAISEVFEDGND